MKKFFKDWWNMVKIAGYFLLLSGSFAMTLLGLVWMLSEGVYVVMVIGGFLLLTGLIAYKKDSFY